MLYESPVIIIYDEDILNEIEAEASSTCHCTMSGARVTCNTAADDEPDAF